MITKSTFGISFFVKKYKQKEEQVPVYARLTVDGKSLDISLKRRVPLANWDEGKGGTKGSKKVIKASCGNDSRNWKRNASC